MFKFLILLALTIVIIIQTAPAYCLGSNTVSFQVSAIMPEHVMFNSNHEALAFSNNFQQISQTQTVIRNNRTISLTSIVAP